VLIELSDTRPGDSVAALAEGVLGKALEEGRILDAAIAQSEAQAKAFWKLRELVSDAQAQEGPNVKHDVSIPISRIPEFVRTTDAQLARAHPGIRTVTFGHVGDGNVHYNVSAPEGVAPDLFMKETAAINLIVHNNVARFRGSISAEHGLGQSKRDEARRYKTPLELDLMKKIKNALDPHGIMNPGKVL
jgi:FAD/FMN-containing dehydrogenase